MLVPRARVHPGRLLLRRKAKEGVDQEEALFCAGSLKEEVVVAAVAESMRTQHALPGGVVCPDKDAEVANGIQLVCLRQSRQPRVAHPVGDRLLLPNLLGGLDLSESSDVDFSAPVLERLSLVSIPESYSPIV
nr:unnamed protein product [Spirometra erinaceieuropaei]